MNKTCAETAYFFNQLSKQLESHAFKYVGVAPPFTSLNVAGSLVNNSCVWLGAQNMGLAEKGAHTGEISPLMLKEHGVKFVILGHSERRSIYHETDTMVEAKVEIALESGMIPIVCVGETLEQRKAGQTLEVVSGQINRALDGIENPSRVVLAYEPLWAIGTGKVASVEDVERVHSGIRAFLDQKCGNGVGEMLSILYGGSVNEKNIANLAKIEGVDGFLVGGASLKIEDFVSLIRLTEEHLS